MYELIFHALRLSISFLLHHAKLEELESGQRMALQSMQLTTIGSSTPNCLIILGVHGPAVIITFLAMKLLWLVCTITISPGTTSVTL